MKKRKNKTQRAVVVFLLVLIMAACAIAAIEKRETDRYIESVDRFIEEMEK